MKRPTVQQLVDTILDAADALSEREGVTLDATTPETYKVLRWVFEQKPSVKLLVEWRKDPICVYRHPPEHLER